MTPFSRKMLRENEGIYLHRSGPLLKNGLDRPENRYGRCGFAWFFQHFHLYRRCGWSESFPLKFLFLALWVVVVVDTLSSLMLSEREGHSRRDSRNVSEQLSDPHLVTLLPGENLTLSRLVPASEHVALDRLPTSTGKKLCQTAASAGTLHPPILGSTSKGMRWKESDREREKE